MNPAIKTADQYRWFTKRNWALLAKFHSRPSIVASQQSKGIPEHVGSIVTATGGVVKAYQIRPDLPKLFPHTEKNAA